MKKPTILLILLLLLCINAYSQKSQPVAYAVFKDSTLTFYYNDKKPEGAYDVENMIKERKYYIKEWASVSNKITTVVFDTSFKEYRPKRCDMWFLNCNNLTSIKGIEENLNTSEVTDMSGMFTGCESLTTLDISGFNTEKVYTMMGMFAECKKLASLDVSGFNTENVTDMGLMFWCCESLSSLDVSGFRTDNVKDMNGMFWTCKCLMSLDVSSFNTDNVLNMKHLFNDCEELRTIYVGDGWNTSNVTESDYMFENCYNLVGGQGTKYDENHTDVEYAHIDGGESNPGYFTKKTK